MRKIKFILGLVSILLSASLLAATPNRTEEELKNEIQSLIKQFPHVMSLADDQIVLVECQVNDRNEIVVINIESQNEEIVNYIRRRLNFKRLKSGQSMADFRFRLPIRFKGRI